MLVKERCGIISWSRETPAGLVRRPCKILRMSLLSTWQSTRRLLIITRRNGPSLAAKLCASGLTRNPCKNRLNLVVEYWTRSSMTCRCLVEVKGASMATDDDLQELL